jgi:hypothetical protein
MLQLDPYNELAVTAILEARESRSFRRVPG